PERRVDVGRPEREDDRQEDRVRTEPEPREAVGEGGAARGEHADEAAEDDELRMVLDRPVEHDDAVAREEGRGRDPDEARVEAAVAVEKPPPGDGRCLRLGGEDGPHRSTYRRDRALA